LDGKQKELFDWIKLARLRVKSGGCETKGKVVVEEGVARQRLVKKKRWIGLNNVEEWIRNGLTHAG